MRKASARRRQIRYEAPSFFETPVHTGLAVASYPALGPDAPPFLTVAALLDREGENRARVRLETATSLRLSRHGTLMALELFEGDRSLGMLCRTAPLDGDPLVPALAMIDEMCRRGLWTEVDLALFSAPGVDSPGPGKRLALERVALPPDALSWRVCESGSGCVVLTTLDRQHGHLNVRRSDDEEELRAEQESCVDRCEILGSDLGYCLVVNNPQLVLHALCVPCLSRVVVERQARCA